MKVYIPNENGFLPEKYSKHSDVKINGSPVISFPVTVEGVPENAVTLALTFVDYDSIPVCGFAWIHWTAANIPANVREIPEDASRKGMAGMVQGANSLISPFVGEKDERVTLRYIGPTPPDCDHTYTLTVYALDCKLESENGFYMNDLLKKADGHIIDEAVCNIRAHC